MQNLKNRLNKLENKKIDEICYCGENAFAFSADQINSTSEICKDCKGLIKPSALVVGELGSGGESLNLNRPVKLYAGFDINKV